MVPTLDSPSSSDVDLLLDDQSRSFSLIDVFGSYLPSLLRFQGCNREGKDQILMK